MRQSNENITSREYEEWQHDKEVWEATAAHQVRLKEMDIELAKLEAKWASWLKIPKLIILLPVYVVFGLAFCIAQITKQEMPEQFWNLLK